MVLIEKLHRIDSSSWKVLRWALMAAIIFWVIVYRTGSTAKVADFVYVNF